jgi:hypothetical protein
VFSKALITADCIVGDHVDGVRLCLWTAATNGPNVHPPDVMSMDSHGGMILTGKNRRTRRKKRVPVPLCPSEISHGLTWEWNRVYAMRGWGLTTWAMARPTRLCRADTENYFQLGLDGVISKRQGLCEKNLCSPLLQLYGLGLVTCSKLELLSEIINQFRNW